MDLPARIGKYELQEFLGGGMSHVYKAHDTVLGRTVAVKILTEQGCTDPETKARFLQEARMAGNFAHDHIIRVFDFGEDQGRPFMIMEFLRGETVREAIKGKRTGDLKNKLSIALQIAQALDYIHSLKIIHRDVKPDNVHIDTAGRVKLMDFGIAKAQSVTLTRAGFTLGTPYYMAPEQVLGQQLTPLVDVYAFGILMFELIAGAKPVMADSIDKVFQQILSEPLNTEPLVQANTPRNVMDIIERCTAKNPQERIQGFALVATELERAIATLKAQTAVAPTVTNAGIPVQALTSGQIRTVQAQAGISGQRPATGSNPVVIAEEPLPGFMKKLPPKFHTQEWFIAIVALGVLFGLTLVGLLLRGFVRLIS